MINFRPIERSDLSMLKEWRNSDNVRQFTREYRLLNDSDQEEWYNSYLKSRRKSDFDQEIYIINNQVKTGTISSTHCTTKDCFNSESIGVGGFTRIEWRNQKAELTFYCIHRQNEEIIKESIKLLITRGFNEFNFNKITWPVYAHDTNLKIYQSIFDTEAILKKEYFWNGKFQDRIYLSKIRDY